MATWEDGPEYAPLERPADFTASAAPALSIAPPYEQSAALAPKPRPAFHDPGVPVAPLATLTPPVPDRRDPTTPFEVVSSAMAADGPRPADSAWGAVHWGPPSGAPVAPPPVPFQAAQPIVLPSAAAPRPESHFPAPGTPEWFAPQPPAQGYRQQPPASGRIGAREVLAAATPGLCICLLVGGLVYILAPVLLATGLALAGRVQVAQAGVRRAFGIAVALLALVALTGALGSNDGFGEWWGSFSRWAMAGCWILLATTLALVYRGLKAAAAPPVLPWR